MPTKEDIDSLSHILQESEFELQEEPNIVFHIYKNRRGKYQNTKIWSHVNLGTCRVKNLFVTTNDYSFIPVEAINIQVEN